MIGKGHGVLLELARTPLLRGDYAVAYKSSRTQIQTAPWWSLRHRPTSPKWKVTGVVISSLPGPQELPVEPTAKEGKRRKCRIKGRGKMEGSRGFCGCVWCNALLESRPLGHPVRLLPGPAQTLARSPPRPVKAGHTRILCQGCGGLALPPSVDRSDSRTPSPVTFKVWWAPHWESIWAQPHNSSFGWFLHTHGPCALSKNNP